jgi:hypothetical protein
VAVLGLSMTGIVGQHSPASTGQLRRELDSIGLQFFKPIAESHSGHGWCRPHCPEVRRVYRSPDTSAQAVLFDVGSRLLARHLLPDDAALRTPTLGASIHGQTAHYAVDARIDHADATLRVRTVTITLRSRRG